MYRRLYNLVSNHRIRDKAVGLYDKENHITKTYLIELENKDTCFHCQCKLDWQNLQHIRRDKQVTLQRIDNKKGHIKGNVVWSCFNCNVKNRVEHREMILNRFHKDRTYTYEQIREILFESDL